MMITWKTGIINYDGLKQLLQTKQLSCKIWAVVLNTRSPPYIYQCTGLDQQILTS